MVPGARFLAVEVGLILAFALLFGSLERWANTERILQLGGTLFVLGLSAFGYAMWSWARIDFGNLFDPFIPRILMLGLTAMVIGIQIAFAAFFFGIFDIGHMSRTQPHD
jgi:hypothetical protein